MDKTKGFEEILTGITGLTQATSNATTADINSGFLKSSGALSSKLKQREANLATGSYIADNAASGLAVSGSILDQISSSQRQGIQDAVNIKMQYNIEAINKKYEAKSQTSAGLTSFGSQILKSVPYFKKT